MLKALEMKYGILSVRIDDFISQLKIEKPLSQEVAFVCNPRRLIPTRDSIDFITSRENTHLQRNRYLLKMKKNI